MRAEEYLDQIKKIDEMILNKLDIIKGKNDDYNLWWERASGLGGVSESERVQSSRNLQQIPDAIAKYMDIEREIERLNQQIEVLKQKREDIIKTIELLPSIEYKIIYKLYVKDFTMKEIAYNLHMSYEGVKKRKNKALRFIQNIIDKERG